MLKLNKECLLNSVNVYHISIKMQQKKKVLENEEDLNKLHNFIKSQREKGKNDSQIMDFLISKGLDKEIAKKMLSSLDKDKSYCFSCGAKNTSSAKFCQSCGVDLTTGVNKEQVEILNSDKMATQIALKIMGVILLLIGLFLWWNYMFS